MHVSRSLPSALWRVLALTAALGFTSCSNGPGGEKLYQVTGKVLYNDQPAAGAVVAFHPKDAKNELTAMRPMGSVQPDGTFSLVTGKDQGAPAGEYIVTVTWYQEIPRKGKA